MKKHIILLSILGMLSVPYLLQAQAGWQWGVKSTVRDFDDGTEGDVYIDREGNTYVIGEYNSSGAIEPLYFEGTDSTRYLPPTWGGSQDVFFTKYNACGEVEWSLSIGGYLENRIYQMIANSNDSLFYLRFYDYSGATLSHQVFLRRNGGGTDTIIYSGGYECLLIIDKYGNLRDQSPMSIEDKFPLMNCHRLEDGIMEGLIYFSTDIGGIKSVYNGATYPSIGIYYVKYDKYFNVLTERVIDTADDVYNLIANTLIAGKFNENSLISYNVVADSTYWGSDLMYFSFYGYGNLFGNIEPNYLFGYNFTTNTKFALPRINFSTDNITSDYIIQQHLVAPEFNSFGDTMQPSVSNMEEGIQILDMNFNRQAYIQTFSDANNLNLSYVPQLLSDQNYTYWFRRQFKPVNATYDGTTLSHSGSQFSWYMLKIDNKTAKLVDVIPFPGGQLTGWGGDRQRVVKAEFDKQGNMYIVMNLVDVPYIIGTDTIKNDYDGATANFAILKYGYGCMDDSSALRAPEPPGSLVATAESNSIKVNWDDNSMVEEGYILYRSTDSVNWTIKDSLPRNSTEYLDMSVQIDTVYYYRCAAYTTGGGASYPSNVDSAVIKIIGIEPIKEIAMALYPNPSKDGYFVLQMNSPEAQSGTIELISPNGQIADRKAIQIQSGANKIAYHYPLTANGYYLLKISTDTYKHTQRVVILSE